MTHIHTGSKDTHNKPRTHAHSSAHDKTNAPNLLKVVPPRTLAPEDHRVPTPEELVDQDGQGMYKRDVIRVHEHDHRAWPHVRGCQSLQDEVELGEEALPWGTKPQHLQEVP